MHALPHPWAPSCPDVNWSLCSDYLVPLSVPSASVPANGVSLSLSWVVRNKYDQQKRHFKKKLSCGQVEPKQRDDKYWAARNDLATPQRERAAVRDSRTRQQSAGSREVTRGTFSTWPSSWWHSDPRNGAGTGQ